MSASRARIVLAACALACLGVASRGLHAVEGEEARAWNALRSGAIVLFRHANAPGVGDPTAFRLGDCATQRNLDAAGRVQARAIGARLRAEKVAAAQVWTSRWCRARDTATLMAVGPVRAQPAFDSFFGKGGRAETAQTRAARAALLAFDGPGTLVVVTHQVNITALTGVVPQEGEGVVLQRRDGALRIVGSLQP